MLVTTGSACAPIAAIVETSPAMPPEPLASLALKVITQAGAGCSCSASASVSVGVGSAVIGRGGKRRDGAAARPRPNLQTSVKNVAYVPTMPCFFRKARGYNLRAL